MKLSTKMYSGFGTVVLIAAVLGFTGWLGVSQMREHMDTYADWGNIDMVMNEGVTQTVLQLNNALSDYMRQPDDASLKGLQGAVVAAQEGAGEGGG